ncbi:carbohydrate-binding protein [Paenibacillus glucanolyticus]|uniref:carbohydrate-binding protein n=1 Tax=Paenibacillus glucanolyticus TaxID=59843 RepID=UPI0034CDDBF1
MSLKRGDLAFWDITRDRYCVESGSYTLMVGPSSGQVAETAVLQIAGETIPPRSLLEPVRAVNYDDYQNVFIDECREGGESIRMAGDSGWIAFHDVSFDEAFTAFEARVSGHIKGGEVIVRTGSPDGPEAGSCRVPPTGGRQAWTTVKAPLTGLAGRHNVFLAFTGEVQISWFRIT